MHFTIKLLLSKFQCRQCAFIRQSCWIWSSSSRYSSTAKIKRDGKQVQKLVSPLKKPIASSQLVKNVGIIAHIDAGKTTTTERMLYYAGLTDDIGSVDKGSTATDFLSQERERGITIQSAAVSFYWREHRVNLIDTPGHIDFTLEVERALRVLDGAVGILDASAGVEAQTKTVWKQADRYNIPRIVFLNKMDKRGSDVNGCLHSLVTELNVKPLLTQINLGSEQDFEGLVDLTSMQCLTWKRKSLGSEFNSRRATKADLGSLYDTVVELRHKLIDQLAELDEPLMNHVIMTSSYDDITAEVIHESLKRATMSHKAVPVLLGSSLKNCGVQPLMDAITMYLPSPEDANHPYGKEFGEGLCAFAFKTIHEKERGAITFLKVYSGTLKSSMSVHNASQECTEKIGKLYTILADQLVEVKTAESGSIVAVTGLQKAFTGDTLVNSATALAKVEKFSSDTLVLPSIKIPDPVFMCSVETYSARQRKELSDALLILQREDPSIRVKVDPETEQVILSGMGELHLEILKDRILKEFKLDVYLGPMRIAYRECIQETTPNTTLTLENMVDDTKNHVTVTLEVTPKQGDTKEPVFIRSEEENWNRLKWFHKKPINHGVKSALSSGPLLGFPVVDVEVRIHEFILHTRSTSAAMISAAVYQCVHKALLDTGIILKEPVMKLQIDCEDEHVSPLLSDLSQRRAHITSVSAHDNHTRIDARSPVATLLGYSTTVRILSSGKATMTMEIDGYTDMTEQEQTETVEQFRV